MSGPMIPIHPQPGRDRTDELRWILPAGVLPFVGLPSRLPASLAALTSDGTLAGVRVEHGAVVTRLGEGRSWPVEGPRVRTALHEALAQPSAWRPAEDDGEPGTDAALRAAAADLIAGSVGQFARSHGGAIELVDVHDGVVEVRLGGACHGCPAAEITMHARLERQLRERCAGLREVRAVGTDPAGHAEASRSGRLSWARMVR